MPTVHSRLRSRLLCIATVAIVVAGLLPATVSAAPPAGAPTLLTPTSGELVSANPTFSWTAVGGATKYRVQISTVSNFLSFVYNVDTVNLKATPTADLPLGTLYWRVAGTDGGSGIGPFTVSSFDRQWGNAPTIIAPNDLATFDFPSNPVLFRWQSLPGAKSYTLEIDDAIDFIGATAFTTNNTSLTLTEPQTIGQSFFWRLQATSSTGGVVSAWTDPRQYTYTWSEVPTLLTPPDDPGLLSPTTDITFSWAPVVGAKTYQLQISPNGDWANNVIADVAIKGTKYTPPTTLDNGAYFWRVRAKDAKSTPNNGGWSDEFQFTRAWPDRPTILAPAWDQTDPSNIPVIDLPFLQWTAVQRASHYQIILGNDPNFPGGSYVTCTTNHTTLTVHSPGGCDWGLTYGEVVYWKVRAIDGPSGVLGQWSADDAASTYRFIYYLLPPTLVSPANNATLVQTPTLVWNAQDNIERYVVTIKNNLNVTIKTATTYATSYTPDILLDSTDGPFSWYVTTIDGLGNPGLVPASGSWFHFNVTTPTTSLTFAITSPGDGTSSVRMPKMTWQPYTGADYYKVRYGLNGGLYVVTPLSGSTKLHNAGFTYAGVPLASGTYKWYIEAYSAADALIASSAEQTFIVSAPDTLGTSDYLSPAKCVVLVSCVTLGDTPILHWQAIPGAGAYEVTLANDSQFTNVIKTYKTIFTTLSPSESFLDQQAGQAVYWFVKPCVDYALSRCGPNAQTNANANASAFRKNSAPVELATPNDGATFADQVTFTWTDYLLTNQALSVPVQQEAKSYKIEISLVSDFASIFDTAIVDQTRYTAFSKTFPEGPLYWRLQAIDGSGNTLTKSGSRLLTKASNPLTPTFPVNASTVTGVPYFSWNPQAFAATYTIEVYKNGDTSFSPANRVLNLTTKFSAWAPTTSLARGAYAWRVRRADADARLGPWSAPMTFNLLPDAPTLLNPANGATLAGDRLYFTWASASAAVQYKFEVQAGVSCSFSTITYTATTVMTAWAATQLYPNGSYCWRVSVLDAAGNVVATSSSRTFGVGAPPPPPPSPTTYVAIDPVRVLDSRVANGLSGKFNANTARSVLVAGRLGIPAEAIAITGNLTVVGQTAAGFLAATPELNNSPSTSALNFPLGDVRANNITSPLGAAGGLSIVYKATAGKTADVLLDISGYFLADNSGATYNTVTPVRLLDTRVANGLTGDFSSNTPRTWQIGGRGNVPLDAVAVTGNLTVVGQTAAGYVSLGPVATSTPTSSTLNFPLGDVRANGLTVALAGDGTLSAVYKAVAGRATHLLFDVTGYYSQNLNGSKFVPLTPGRVLDSRVGTGLAGKFNSNTARTLGIDGHVGVPTGAVAITGNLTVVNQTAAGYVSLTQTATNTPTTSTINFPLGDVRANGVTSPLDASGDVGLVYKATAGKTADVILDITGYFDAAP